MPIRSFAALSAAALIALSFTGPAHAISKAEQRKLFFGHDDRHTLVPDALPWRAIGQIETASGSICTATLVADDVVLTAGHCFKDPDTGRFDPAVTFSAALNGKHAAARVATTRVFVDRRLFAGLTIESGGLLVDPRVARYDYAFVRLAEPIGRTLGTLPLIGGDRATLKANLDDRRWRVTQAGYPIDDPSHLTVHEQCRATKLLADGRLSHRCDTLPGDSGSPLLLIDGNGKATIIALQSSAPSAADRYRADNMALSVPAFRAALDRFIASGAGPKPAAASAAQ
ncbi:serine protease [Crenobacter sp. SG2305]|uniref:trypsin-like serine peptidase n=1 Tax=Crenobacter oryzisoli TaxID=3056844 RepID=UPI0025AB0176|nr:serine protease [Crenobacter sp. SG2305]MDN0085389.1 serine protease [Crenobacter sp. SG2305]